MTEKKERHTNEIILGNKQVELYFKIAMEILSQNNNIVIYTTRRHLHEANEICHLLSVCTEEITKREETFVEKDLGEGKIVKYASIRIQLNKLPELQVKKNGKNKL